MRRQRESRVKDLFQVFPVLVGHNIGRRQELFADDFAVSKLSEGVRHPFHSKPLIRITSFIIAPRVTARCFPSRDHANLKICSELKYVNCRSGPPPTGRTQMLAAPVRVSMYASPSPSGVQRSTL